MEYGDLHGTEATKVQKLENYEVKGFQGDWRVSDAKIARTVAVGKDAYDIIKRECGENPEKRSQYLKEATRRPITVDEQKNRDGISLRRCPACLGPKPSRMTYCFVCKSEFWCRPISVTSAVPKPESPTYRVPTASSSSSAPPTVVAAQPELKLPDASGVIWEIETHKGYSYVKPEKRLVTPVDGT